MGSLSTQDWNSSREKNFKAHSKKKTHSNFSRFDDEFDEMENYPQLNRYKKQDYRLTKRKDFKGNFDQA